MINAYTAADFRQADEIAMTKPKKVSGCSNTFTICANFSFSVPIIEYLCNSLVVGQLSTHILCLSAPAFGLFYRVLNPSSLSCVV